MEKQTSSFDSIPWLLMCIQPSWNLHKQTSNRFKEYIHWFIHDLLANELNTPVTVSEESQHGNTTPFKYSWIISSKNHFLKMHFVLHIFLFITAWIDREYPLSDCHNMVNFNPHCKAVNVTNIGCLSL